jgi:hypothetical protein
VKARIENTPYEAAALLQFGGIIIFGQNLLTAKGMPDTHSPAGGME